MVDHSLARKKLFLGLRGSPGSGDAVFDMIDDRVSRMLTKSSEIDSRLRDLELASKSGSPTTQSSQSTWAADPQKRRATAATASDGVLRPLFDALERLSTELSDLRNEQKILRTQVDELHRVVLSDDI
jgi:hypothetical protein